MRLWNGISNDTRAKARRRRLWSVAPATWLTGGGVLAVGLAAVTALNGHGRTGPWPVLGVTALTVHLLAVAAWVGGLAVLVVVGGAAWRRVAPEDRPGLARQAVLGRG